MLKRKIISLSGLKRILTRLRKKRKRIVFTNGCFDLLHFGHVDYLQEAKKKGDILVVAVNSDASIRKIKGKKRPIINEKNRLSVVAALQSVDYVVLFKEDTPLKVIKTLKPDILVKGADWDKKDIVGSDFVLSRGGEVITIKLSKGYSTTDIIKKIA
ncbi:MAG: D-glycero-beta-D-manno-heptose 1-phosphate adenylyltransferase, partial [Candidatus Omnitrophota bacterium]|nr:D-glycero-beta-D-manno-heptose 1-phosphate adenylyltransferase [Candidatus Omnitrophota bacterium]